jgi:hypothetical protein
MSPRTPLLWTVLSLACNEKPAPSPGQAQPAAEPAAVQTAPPTAVDTSGAPSADPTPAPSAAASAGAAPKPSATTALAAKPAGSGGATAASAEPPPVERKGAAVGDGTFSAWLQSAGKYRAGQPGSVTAVLVAKEPYHCNEKYPYKFKLDPAPANLSFPQSTVSGMSVSAARSTMAIPFTANAAGPATISGTLSFSVCTADKCLIEKRPLTVAIHVE